MGAAVRRVFSVNGVEDVFSKVVEVTVMTMTRSMKRSKVKVGGGGGRWVV